MSKMVLCLGMVLLTGCGGSDFDGKWNGTLGSTGTCDSGPFLGGSGTGDIGMEVSGAELKVTYLPCGKDVLADIVGDTATLRATTCREAASGSAGRETLKITGGTLVLSGDKMTITAEIDELTTNGQQPGNCDVSNKGTLTKAE